MSPLRWSLPVLVAAALLATPAARASEEAARAHFASGVKLYDASPPSYAAALAEFRAAYAEKASPGIKRNMALCLRALERYAEAIDALEEMLAEGGDALDPRVREAATRAIDEMMSQVATVRLRVILHAPRGAKAPPVIARIDGVERARATIGTPLHVTPGEHTFRTRAYGYADAEVKAFLAAGERDRTIELEMVAITDGPLDAAPDDRADLPPVPAPYEGTSKDAGTDPAKAPVDLPKLNWYASAGIALGSESRRMSTVFDEPSGGTPRDFSGTSFALRVGRQLGRYLDIEGLGEIGSISPEAYKSPNDPSTNARVSVTTWTLAPVLRFHSAGSIRAVAGLSLGITGQDASGSLSEGTKGGTRTAEGSGIGAMAMAEVGGQFDLGRRFLLDATLFIDAHGVGSATNSSGQALFLDSAASRSGVRLMLGYRF
jgi:tetratricopeptide (TPR) repeat protein